jgi:hypothetical protein
MNMPTHSSGNNLAKMRRLEFRRRGVRRFLVGVLLSLILSLFAIALAWLSSEAASVEEQAYLTAHGRFEQELSQLARSAGGTVGVSAIHIESARRVSLRGNRGQGIGDILK